MTNRGFQFGQARSRRRFGRRQGRRLLWVGLVVALVALDGLVVAIKLEHDRRPPSNITRQKGYGFSTSFDDLSGSSLDAKMAAIQAMGVRWVRFDVSWASVQPRANGPYDWSGPDAVIRAALVHHLTVLPILDFTPTWARMKVCSNSAFCAPASATAYGTFAGAAAAHYKAWGVAAWEIWNEPNISSRFGPAANPVAYANMVIAADKAIKQAEPQAVVVAGSVAPSATDGGNYAPADFVSALYEARAAGWFDALSIHPYTFPKLPSQTGPLDAWGQMQTIHNLMTLHGDGSKQIWVTEFGAPTNGPNPLGTRHVSEDVQAQIATEAIAEFRSNSWAGPFLWYDYQDAGTALDTNENFFGLVRADDSHKPAYDAFEAAIAAHP